jgi:hypothetical protein
MQAYRGDAGLMRRLLDVAERDRSGMMWQFRCWAG